LSKGYRKNEQGNSKILFHYIVKFKERLKASVVNIEAVSKLNDSFVGKS
jgi:hypothetical protein